MASSEHPYIRNLPINFVRPRELRGPQEDPVLEGLALVGLDQLLQGSFLKMAPQVEVALGADGRVDLVAVADHPVADGLFPEPAVEVDLVSAHVEHREVRVDAGHQERVDHVFVDVSEDLQVTLVTNLECRRVF